MSKRPRIKQADGSLLDLPLDAETIQGKKLEEIALKTDIPTKTSQLTNDSGFLTEEQALSGYIPQGGTLSAPLTVTGGDSATAGKIMLDQNNLGQITNTSTQTLFGFTTSTNIAVGHSSYKTNLRGSTIESTANMLTRVLIPVSNNTYTLGSSSNKWKEIHGTTIYQNGKQVANKEDIPTKVTNGYGGFLYSGGDGVTEMGKYIDFHATSTDTKDYDVRFVCPSLNSQVDVHLPSKAGTLAVLVNTGSSNYLSPGVTGTMDLGTNDEKWKDIYMGGKLTDGTPAAIKPSAGNEISFGSSENSIYFGYDNRVGSAGAVNTYNFGTHSGAAGAKSGRINCGDVYVDGGANQVARKSDIPSVGRIQLYDDGRSYSLDVSGFSYVEISMIYNDSPGKSLTFANTSATLYEDTIIDFRISLIDNTYIYIKDGNIWGGGSFSDRYFTLQLQGTSDSSTVTFIYRGYK